MMNILEIEGLRKYYGKQRGVENVSFSIKEMEIFGFIGPNGAGKTTSIRCALSLIFPDAGSIRIFGKDAIRDRAAVAPLIGYLPGEVSYYEQMRVKDLLSYAASFYKKNLDARQKALCERLELDPEKKIAGLSLGNKKKVGIVQALLHEPKLIFFDEATSGLDPLMQKRFFELIEEERRKGATILYSSHNLSEVKKLCDRIAIIREGVIADLRRMDELEKDHYKKIQLQAPEEELTALDSVIPARMQARSQGERVYLFRGDINQLVAQLEKLRLDNLSIEDPSLEEIFMHYYEEQRP